MPLGIALNAANMESVNGSAEIVSRFADVGAGIVLLLFTHQRCARLT